MVFFLWALRWDADNLWASFLFVAQLAYPSCLFELRGALGLWDILRWVQTEVGGYGVLTSHPWLHGWPLRSASSPGSVWVSSPRHGNFMTSCTLFWAGVLLKCLNKLPGWRGSVCVMVHSRPHIRTHTHTHTRPRPHTHAHTHTLLLLLIHRLMCPCSFWTHLLVNQSKCPSPLVHSGRNRRKCEPFFIDQGHVFQ